MRHLFFIVVFCITGCTSSSKSKSTHINYQTFDALTFDENSVRTKQLGLPSEKSNIRIEGEKFQRLTYNNDNGRAILTLLLDPKHQKIVEKTYFPSPESEENRLKFFFKSKYNLADFEKTPVRCRHFNELIYLNKPLGLIITSREGKDPKVDAISFVTPAVQALRQKEHSNTKCW